jgi:hypothetical protein
MKYTGRRQSDFNVQGRAAPRPERKVICCNATGAGAWGSVALSLQKRGNEYSSDIWDEVG